jgi:hypothetical protein
MAHVVRHSVSISDRGAMTLSRGATDQHSTCRLTSALHLIGGSNIRIPAKLFDISAYTKGTRLLQMGYLIGDLLTPPYRHTTLVSGQQLAFQTGNLQYFTDHLWKQSMQFLAKRQPVFKVPQGHPADAISQLTGCDSTPDPEIRLSSHCVVVVIANWNGIPVVLHYGRCESARAEIRRQAMGLRLTSSDRRLEGLVPHLIKFPTLEDGAEFAVETRLAGETCPFDWHRIDQITELWIAEAASDLGIARVELPQELDDLCASLPSFAALLRPAADALLEWHASFKMAADLAHGDLWLGNVLFSADDLTGIIDWEWAHSDGLRILDMLHLLLMSHAVSCHAGVAHHLRQLWEDEVDDLELRSRLTRLSVRFSLDDNDLKFLALLLWFDYLRHAVIRGRIQGPTWLERMIPRTVPSIVKWLHKCSNFGVGCRVPRKSGDDVSEASLSAPDRGSTRA